MSTLFGLGWLVAFWLPVSGIFPIPSAPLADRYLYLPAIGLWLIVADQVSPLVVSRTNQRWSSIGVAVLLATFLTVTVRQNLFWRDDIKLFSRLVSLYPESAYGHHNLGCAYLDKEKNLDLAEQSFERAFALDPLFPRLRTQLGYVQLLRGDNEGAVAHYDHAIYQNPLDAEALLNRGDALEKLGRWDDAVDSYCRFLKTPGTEYIDAKKSVRRKLSTNPGWKDVCSDR
jgi:tetratricopeptide (TPR) repeat protein